MALAFILLILIVHSYVAWAAGRIAAPLPRLARIAVGVVVAGIPLGLLVALDASYFDGTCPSAEDGGVDRAPCSLVRFAGRLAAGLLPYLALPMLIWLGFYSSSLARAKSEAR